MKESTSMLDHAGNERAGFVEELTISATPILAALSVMPVIASLVAWSTDKPELTMNLAVAMYFAIGLALVLCRVWPNGGNGLTVAIALGIVVVLARGYRLPGAMLLASVPVVIASALFPLPGTLLTSAVSIGLALLPQPGGAEPALERLSAVMAVCVVALCVSLRDRAARRLGDWAYSHYVTSQTNLAEARQRQSELKQAIDALAHANRQLELSNERTAIMRRIAEEAQRTKAAFVSNVSHEFRTPLNIIIGLAEVLADGADVYGQDLPVGAQRDIAILYRNTEHLSRMVNDVLDLGQVEAGRMPLRREWCDLDDLVRQALLAMEPLAERRGLYLAAEIEPKLPAVYIDAVRIRQVFLNLVSNAIRHSDEGGVTVAVQRRGQRALISVQDTGSGVAPDNLERIFEPFQQALGQHTREGSGLGLAISRALVEMHQGRMWVESDLGKGSTFFFTLPVGQVQDHRDTSQRWLTEGWVARDASSAPRVDTRPKLIITESGDDLHPVLERYSDAVCFHASTLKEAMGEHDREPAQVLLVNSYDVDEVAQRVARFSDAMPDVPVIGFCVQPRSESGLELDVLDYLLKPVHSTDLERALAMVPSAARILIVDDDDDTRWVLQRYVRSLIGDSAEIGLAEDGAKALSMMESWSPDVVLLDVILQDMSGWQVLAAKRAMPAAAEIPVIMISAQNLVDEPLTSRLVVATMGQGLAWSRMLQVAQNLSSTLIET